ncbi:hypothetical protein ACN4EG_08965 [Alkalinema pantanalense CENA528]|uniref:hypothetical protein n=1 Tax=Alkalinema pantanalense TaxID=1620705 RepID=UPI003D6DDACF
MQDRPYHPIDCDIYDRLLELILRCRICEVVYRNEAGESVVIQAKLVDIYSQNAVEFVRLDSGMVIRLDDLITVDSVVIHGCEM